MRSPTTLLAGKRPPSISGLTFSMTARKRPSLGLFTRNPLFVLGVISDVSRFSYFRLTPYFPQATRSMFQIESRPAWRRIFFSTNQPIMISFSTLATTRMNYVEESVKDGNQAKRSHGGTTLVI